MPRGVHKPDCKCPVCTRRRANAEQPTIPIQEPIAAPVITVGDLQIAQKFLLSGITHRLAAKTPECCVCHTLRFLDCGPLPTDKMWTVDKTISIAITTVVTPVD